MHIPSVNRYAYLHWCKVGLFIAAALPMKVCAYRRPDRPTAIEKLKTRLVITSTTLSMTALAIISLDSRFVTKSNPTDEFDQSDRRKNPLDAPQKTPYSPPLEMHTEPDALQITFYASAASRPPSGRSRSSSCFNITQIVSREEIVYYTPPPSPTKNVEFYNWDALSPPSQERDVSPIEKSPSNSSEISDSETAHYLDVGEDIFD